MVFSARRLTVWSVLVVGCAFVHVGHAGGPAGRAAHMVDHFSRVVLIEQAIVRGDLEDVRGPARWMAEHQALDGLPAAAARHVDQMRGAARRAADAATLEQAAQEAGSLMAACGTCHVAMGRRPSLPAIPDLPITGGIVGHMLEHERAVVQLEYGLVSPSDAFWGRGAESLRTAPLARRKLPPDPALTIEILELEAKAHQLADKARQVRDASGRGALYGTLIASCGRCHGLHGRVWGPGRPAE